MHDDLRLLILQHLADAGDNPLPELPMFMRLRRQVVPEPERADWDEVVLDLVQRELIGFTRDGVDDGKLFFLRKKGQVALRR